MVMKRRQVILSHEDRLKFAQFVLLLAQGKKQGEAHKRQARTRRNPNPSSPRLRRTRGRSPPAQKRQCPPIQMIYEEGHGCAEGNWGLARRKNSAGFVFLII